jgi:hypothetical protein
MQSICLSSVFIYPGVNHAKRLAQKSYSVVYRGDILLCSSTSVKFIVYVFRYLLDLVSKFIECNWLYRCMN